MVIKFKHLNLTPRAPVWSRLCLVRRKYRNNTKQSHLIILIDEVNITRGISPYYETNPFFSKYELLSIVK
jgi:hypothetical protein